MRSSLTDDQFDEEIFGAERYAWRWEQQRQYEIGHELSDFEEFLDGHPRVPTENSSMAWYYDRIQALTRAAGVEVGRVRVVDSPPTDYQRWRSWMDRWNREAGEEILYLPRQVLHQMGGPPFAPHADWWLIDGERLLLMHFAPDGSGRRVPPGTRLETELVVDEPEVHLARLWRLAAISWAREEETSLPAAA